MILSHRHRFVFFAVPRTATHAIRLALREHLGRHDWEQQALSGRQTLPVPELAALGHGHVSYQAAERYLPPRILRSYTTFAFVRNPFDRFVSVCAFLNRDNPEFKGRETTFMRDAIADPRFLERVLAAPQHRMLVDRNGRLALDHVGRYESLQGSFDAICETLALPPVTLQHENASAHRGYAAYYDDALRTVVAEAYRGDFELFGYDPSRP